MHLETPKRTSEIEKVFEEVIAGKILNFDHHFGVLCIRNAKEYMKVRFQGAGEILSWRGFGWESTRTHADSLPENPCCGVA